MTYGSPLLYLLFTPRGCWFNRLIQLVFFHGGYHTRSNYVRFVYGLVEWKYVKTQVVDGL